MHALRPVCCLCLVLLAGLARAEEPAPKQDRLSAAAQPAPARPGVVAAPVIAAVVVKPQHKFIDRDNALLFAAVAAGRTADVLTTWRFRERGYTEVLLSNGFVDNRPAFAAYSFAMVGANVGIAYGLHRLGWHKAERALSVVHFSYAGALAIHNYGLVP